MSIRDFAWNGTGFDTIDADTLDGIESSTFLQGGGGGGGIGSIRTYTSLTEIDSSFDKTTSITDVISAMDNNSHALYEITDGASEYPVADGTVNIWKVNDDRNCVFFLSSTSELHTRTTTPESVGYWERIVSSNNYASMGLMSNAHPYIYADLAWPDEFSLGKNDDMVYLSNVHSGDTLQLKNDHTLAFNDNTVFHSGHYPPVLRDVHININQTGEDACTSLSSNLAIQSWWGVGFRPMASGQLVPKGENATWIDTRTGNVYTRKDYYAAYDKKVYHEGYKPTPAAIGAAPMTGNEIVFANNDYIGYDDTKNQWYTRVDGSTTRRYIMTSTNSGWGSTWTGAITISASAPSASQGSNGDIWITY